MAKRKKRSELEAELIALKALHIIVSLEPTEDSVISNPLTMIDCALGTFLSYRALMGETDLIRFRPQGAKHGIRVQVRK